MLDFAYASWLSIFFNSCSSLNSSLFVFFRSFPPASGLSSSKRLLFRFLSLSMCLLAVLSSPRSLLSGSSFPSSSSLSFTLVDSGANSCFLSSLCLSIHSSWLICPSFPTSHSRVLFALRISSSFFATMSLISSCLRRSSSSRSRLSASSSELDRLSRSSSSGGRP
uniref:Uncharacterized protein n=1 Tax=Cacopsylla melanoneura TaxID=428564 RepID=A0A8D8TTJ7_9HEMI